MRRGEIGAIYFTDYEDGTAEWFLCVDDAPLWPGEPTLLCIKSTYEGRSRVGKRVGEFFSVGTKDRVVLDEQEVPDDAWVEVAKWRLLR